MKQRNYRKKLFSLLLVLSMLLSLAACGETKAPAEKADDKTAQTTPEKTDDKAPEKEAPKGEPVEIQIVSSVQPDVDARIVKIVLCHAARFRRH